jgi:hypothetical protein
VDEAGVAWWVWPGRAWSSIAGWSLESAALPIAASLFCRFLDEVQAHSDVNKMSVQNLATVFGPNILRPQIEDPVTIMEGKGEVIRQYPKMGGLWPGINSLDVISIFRDRATSTPIFGKH